ncbi:Ribosomal biogenesis protein las1l, partial [Cladochytrium tenue]
MQPTTVASKRKRPAVTDTGAVTAKKLKKKPARTPGNGGGSRGGGGSTGRSDQHQEQQQSDRARWFRLPRIVPWASQAEWDDVFSWLFPDPAEATPPAVLRSRGVKRVKAWASRGKVPHAIDATASFAEVWLRDGMGGSHTSDLTESELRLMYAMAFIRFFNGIVDSQQKGVYAQSVSTIADSIGLPPWFVELRHSATHDQLPSLQLLRSGCVQVADLNPKKRRILKATSDAIARQALDWLRENYWLTHKNLPENAFRDISAWLSFILSSDDFRDKIDPEPAVGPCILNGNIYTPGILKLLVDLLPGRFSSINSLGFFLDKRRLHNNKLQVVNDNAPNSGRRKPNEHEDQQGPFDLDSFQAELAAELEEVRSRVQSVAKLSDWYQTNDDRRLATSSLQEKADGPETSIWVQTSGDVWADVPLGHVPGVGLGNLEVPESVDDWRIALQIGVLQVPSFPTAMDAAGPAQTVAGGAEALAATHQSAADSVSKQPSELELTAPPPAAGTSARGASTKASGSAARMSRTEAAATEAAAQLAARERVERAKKTGILTLSETNLRQLPPEVLAVTSLKSFNLPDLSRWAALKILDLSHNQLRSVPPSVATLARLEIL